MFCVSFHLTKIVEMLLWSTDILEIESKSRYEYALRACIPPCQNMRTWSEFMTLESLMQGSKPWCRRSTESLRQGGLEALVQSVHTLMLGTTCCSPRDTTWDFHSTGLSVAIKISYGSHVPNEPLSCSTWQLVCCFCHGTDHRLWTLKKSAVTFPWLRHRTK